MEGEPRGIESLSTYVDGTGLDRRSGTTLVVVVLGTIALLAVGLHEGLQVLVALVAAPTAVAGAYLLWRVDPAYILCAAIS